MYSNQDNLYSNQDNSYPGQLIPNLRQLIPIQDNLYPTRDNLYPGKQFKKIKFYFYFFHSKLIQYQFGHLKTCTYKHQNYVLKEINNGQGKGYELSWYWWELTWIWVVLSTSCLDSVAFILQNLYQYIVDFSRNLALGKLFRFNFN